MPRLKNLCISHIICPDRAALVIQLCLWGDILILQRSSAKSSSPGSLQCPAPTKRHLCPICVPAAPVQALWVLHHQHQHKEDWDCCIFYHSHSTTSSVTMITSVLPHRIHRCSGIGQCVMGAEGALRRAFPRAAPRSRGCFAKSTPAAFPPDQFLPCLMLLFAKRSRELERSCKPFLGQCVFPVPGTAPSTLPAVS